MTTEKHRTAMSREQDKLMEAERRIEEVCEELDVTREALKKTMEDKTEIKMILEKKEEEVRRLFITLEREQRKKEVGLISSEGDQGSGDKGSGDNNKEQQQRHQKELERIHAEYETRIQDEHIHLGEHERLVETAVEAVVRHHRRRMVIWVGTEIRVVDVIVQWSVWWQGWL